MDPQREDLPGAIRIFGVETEYGFAALDMHDNAKAEDAFQLFNDLKASS